MSCILPALKCGWSIFLDLLEEWWGTRNPKSPSQRMCGQFTKVSSVGACPRDQFSSFSAYVQCLTGYLPPALEGWPLTLLSMLRPLFPAATFHWVGVPLHPASKHLISDLSHSTYKGHRGFPIWATLSTGPPSSLFNQLRCLHVPFCVGGISGHSSWPMYFNSAFNFFLWVGFDIWKSYLIFILWLQNIHLCLSILIDSSIWPLISSSESTRMWKV